jgi:hypothetical protein
MEDDKIVFLLLGVRGGNQHCAVRKTQPVDEDVAERNICAFLTQEGDDLQRGRPANVLDSWLVGHTNEQHARIAHPVSASTIRARSATRCGRSAMETIACSISGTLTRRDFSCQSK